MSKKPFLQYSDDKSYDNTDFIREHKISEPEINSDFRIPSPK